MQFDPAPPSNHADGAARLLIVEPNRSALQVLAKRLGETGYRIVACDNAGNATAARIPMIAITIINSINVKPFCTFFME